jgi:hypothetical protein
MTADIMSIGDTVLRRDRLFALLVHGSCQAFFRSTR